MSDMENQTGKKKSDDIEKVSGRKKSDDIRKRIYEVIEADDDNDKLSKLYDWFMIAVISLSLVPLIFKTATIELIVIDKVCAGIFIIDYILRLMTADFKLKGKDHPFLRYPFTLMAVIDLISILPSLVPLSGEMLNFRVLKALRIMRFLKVLRIIKFSRYSRSCTRLMRVLQDTKDSLLAVCSFAILYIFISAIIMFNVEPQTFSNFFEALYWATVSLITVGYGDIYPVTTIGRIITMISALFGVAIVALPASVITAGYMNELEREEKDKDIYYD